MSTAATKQCPHSTSYVLNNNAAAAAVPYMSPVWSGTIYPQPQAACVHCKLAEVEARLLKLEERVDYIKQLERHWREGLPK